MLCGPIKQMRRKLDCEPLVWFCCAPDLAVGVLLLCFLLNFNQLAVARVRGRGTERVGESGEGERGEGQAGSYLLSTTTQTKAALAIVASSALRAWVVDFGRGCYWALKSAAAVPQPATTGDTRPQSGKSRRLTRQVWSDGARAYLATEAAEPEVRSSARNNAHVRGSHPPGPAGAGTGGAPARELRMAHGHLRLSTGPVSTCHDDGGGAGGW